MSSAIGFPPGRQSWLYASIAVQLITLYCCQAARVTIDDTSPRVVYNTPVLQETTCKFNLENSACTGHWWLEHSDSRGEDFNNTVHTTFGPVRIDCNVTSLPNGVSLATQQLLFSKSGLDPSVPHKIVVAYDDSAFDKNATHRAWFSIDYFEVDEPDTISSSSTTWHYGATTLPSGLSEPYKGSTSVTPTSGSSPGFTGSAGSSGFSEAATQSGDSAGGSSGTGSPARNTANSIADVRTIVGGVLVGLAVALVNDCCI
ncbi:hypothetical protein AURDEDRAFT_129969 [Auricularia subglabra TFB-10046 SS5]|nr:hypothetical protein AURDEDRAFT_129969 [Auricularia subglabra TFB-10046 SS5]